MEGTWDALLHEQDGKKTKGEMTYKMECAGLWLDVRLLFVTAWVLLAELFHSAWSYVTLPSHQAIEHGYQQIVGSLNNDG